MVELATRERLDERAVIEIATAFEDRSPQDVLRWAIAQFGSRLAISTSFQAEGMAILDMAWRIEPRVRVITVDTGRLHPQTYELMEQVRDRYHLPIEIYYPDPAALEPFVHAHGINPFYRSVTNRFRCCDIRKVDPLARALTTVAAWVSGQRRGHSETRRNVRAVELDQTHEGLIKLNPLASWTGEQVWDYLRANDVPHNALYDQGYTSIGCAPCTRPTKPGEDPRAGRWWWEEDLPKECGINFRIDPVSGRLVAGPSA
jgi:thioredoxin-dependent adenylylsulfate APS reductase